jgi:hypothetical protein
MSPIQSLAEVVREQTEVFRKGEVVKDSRAPGFRVTTIDAFPESPGERVVQVDCHFVTVGFTEAATDRQAFLDAREKAMADHGEFADIDAARMAAGPSYIEIGGWIGDQTLAFQFMALSEFHEVGKVITPRLLGAPEAMWDQLAGGGYVLLAPRQTEPEATDG